MPRFYIKNEEGLWNIFSTIVDEYYFPEFISYDELEHFVLLELLQTKRAELETLKTENPELNVMSIEEAEERRKMNEEQEHEN